MNIDAKWIKKIHVQQNGWKDIGYHYVIKRSGEIERGRKDETAGAHCEGHNTGTLGICLVGGISETGRPENNFTPAQFMAVQELIYSLKEKYPTIVKLSGHSDYANKACPCFNVHEKLKL